MAVSRKRKGQIRLDGSTDVFPEVEAERGRGKGPCIPDDMLPIVPTARLAGILGMSERHVQRLRNEGMPRHSRGRWDLSVVVPWVLERVERRAAPEDGTATEAQRRYYVGRAALTEMEVARRRSEHVDLETHQAIVADLVIALVEECQSIPMRDYHSPEDRAIAQHITDRIRARLSERAATVGPGRRQSGQSAEAASAT